MRLPKNLFSYCLILRAWFKLQHLFFPHTSPQNPERLFIGFRKGMRTICVHNLEGFRCPFPFLDHALSLSFGVGYAASTVLPLLSFYTSYINCGQSGPRGLLLTGIVPVVHRPLGKDGAAGLH